jgi:hypothetical protein
VATSARRGRDYAGRLFNNVYNYGFILALGAVFMLGKDGTLLLSGLALEAALLVVAPNLRATRAWLDPVLDLREQKARERQRAIAILALPGQPRQRCQVLFDKQQQLKKLMAERPALEGAWLSEALLKLDGLIAAFVELALSSHRFSEHLRHEDVAALKAKAEGYAEEAAHSKGTGQAIARENRDILTQRIARLDEIRSFLAEASGRLSLIENTVQLLIDEVVSMHGPQPLATDLDALIGDVDTVRQTAQQVDQWLARKR